ncbi:sulfur carrier protein ThiS [Alphaproteobacteria bacterium]|nr:sulfur carrier protein ThiS [Alphaproteobacteria bacterium]
MKISINGVAKDVTSTNLAAVLLEAGYGDARVATAVNGQFVPVGQRESCPIKAGDQVEIVAPRQGG